MLEEFDLQDLINDGYVVKYNNKYVLTNKGMAVIKSTSELDIVTLANDIIEKYPDEFKDIGFDAVVTYLESHMKQFEKTLRLISSMYSNNVET